MATATDVVGDLHALHRSSVLDSFGSLKLGVTTAVIAWFVLVCSHVLFAEEGHALRDTTVLLLGKDEAAQGSRH